MWSTKPRMSKLSLFRSFYAFPREARKFSSLIFFLLSLIIQEHAPAPEDIYTFRVHVISIKENNRGTCGSCMTSSTKPGACASSSGLFHEITPKMTSSSHWLQCCELDTIMCSKPRIIYFPNSRKFSANDGNQLLLCITIRWKENLLTSVSRNFPIFESGIIHTNQYWRLAL